MEKTIQGKAMSLGSVMIDIEGTRLTEVDRERLMNPLVAGVILFSRHFESVEQLQKLTQEIHSLRHPRLLIAVDHEGGRVQRFKEGFSRLPAMRLIGELYDTSPDKAQEVASNVGWLMATELLAVGVDFSFAPVVDLDFGGSRVIGDRAFHSNPQVVADLTWHLMNGMHKAGMASVAKHFPGHGYIEADTHYEIAVDERSFNEISQHDLQPFLRLIENQVEAVMPAHVIYPKVDALPAGFSKHWLQDVLRKQCHFEGAIISDDLSMKAAEVFGTPSKRVTMALEAGCDLVLVCNDSTAADDVLANVRWQGDVLSHARLIRLHGKPHLSYSQLHKDPIWQAKSYAVNHFVNESNQQALLG
ncbi:beta-N-acetylhexosaminidase [Hydrogenovibrio sp. JE_KL2]|uniref:beta-N-acetylhexosaminidase n=1 Tax=Hydrogenovibrio sp. JE_KL2 TaxID=2651188 RepID=UPI00128B1F95|nr:beta-N-acetylhexosaminidase [Hydrogenovibrio sp. JE_KL2]MPQ76085.1 beta-N-acetylhexosaminidase [Hydrogenovibrio sp. JE_KL2]